MSRIRPELPALPSWSEVLDRIREALFQLRDAGTLERDDIASVDDFAVKDSRFVVKFNFADRLFVFHHGVTPAAVRNRRGFDPLLGRDHQRLVRRPPSGTENDLYGEAAPHALAA
jgi:hypothetical protein